MAAPRLALALVAAICRVGCLCGRALGHVHSAAATQLSSNSLLQQQQEQEQEVDWRVGTEVTEEATWLPICS
jgi:hypothetical protein